MAIMIALIPVSAAFLVLSMLRFGTESAAAIISYVLSAYTLTVWCVRIPDIIRWIKHFKETNKYWKIWASDENLRVNASLYLSLGMNAVFSLFQLCLGFYHGSFWFYSLAFYYFVLAAMRFYLLRYTRAHRSGGELYDELLRYRACGFVFLFMNLILSSIVIFMIRYDRTFTHHRITTIAIAAYTFLSLTLAIINAVKFRRYHSPVYSASKAVSLAAASVSMLTLETTMLTAFGNGEADAVMRRIMLALSGGAISVFLILMALYIIIRSSSDIRKIKERKSADAE